MADISKITLPNGSSYNFKDATARSGLEGKAPTSHTHDDRYYTESEINTKLSQKIDMGGIIHVARKPTSNGYLKFADITTSGYGNKSIGLWVSTEYNNGTSYLGNAIAYINIRGNGANTSGVSKFSWLMKDENFNTDLYYAVNDHTIEFYRYVKSGKYSQTSFKILNIGNFENASNWTFNLKSVAFVENTPLDTPIGTVVGMTNEGLVEYSNNADTVDGKHASDFATVSHTHNYAGSTSAGGVANKAVELVDYADSNHSVKVGYAGSSLTINEFTGFAGFTSRDSTGTAKIKDVSVDTVKSKLGLKSAAYSETSAFAATSHTHTKSQITDFPTIPTKTSQLTNDSGFKTTDNNTTYSLSKSGSTITLTGSDGKATSVTDSDTTYTLPAATSSTLGGVKIGSNITNSNGTISLTKANVTAALGYTPPTTNTTYGVATTSTDGLMSAAMVTKLNKISITSTTATLSASGWNSNSQTISVSEVNANSIVFITPAPQSQDEYIVAYINCTNQDNGSLTFTCKYIPENDLQINLVIL